MRPTEPRTRPITPTPLLELWFAEDDEATSSGDPPPLPSPLDVTVLVLEVDVEEPCPCGWLVELGEAEGVRVFGATVVLTIAT